MRAFHRLNAIGVVVAATLGACGSAQSAAGAGQSPKEMLRVAKAQLSGSPVRLDVDGRLSLDASHLTNVPPDALKSLGDARSIDVRLSGSGAQESKERATLTLGVTPGLDHPATLVLYDGALYTSADGRRFSSTAAPKRASTPDTGSTRGLDSVVDLVRDLGPTTMDSQSVERLELPLDRATLQTLLTRLSATHKPAASQSPTPGNQAGALGQLLLQFVDVKRGAVDAYVSRTDGRLDRVTADIDVSIDVGRISGLAANFGGFGQGQGAAKLPAQPLPGGTAEFSVHLSAHLHGYGESIHIDRPTSDPNAPRLPGLDGLRGGQGLSGLLSGLLPTG